MWFFVVADLGGSAFLFCLFVTALAAEPVLFEASRRQLHVGFGLADTLILLTSGALMTGAVAAARNGRWAQTARRIRIATIVGGGFVTCKAAEWTTELRAGASLTTEPFFASYIALTGIHLFHTLIGMVVLVAVRRAARSDRDAATRLRWVEAGGSYRHMVDLLWVVLFAMP